MKISLLAFLVGLTLSNLSFSKEEAEQFKNTKWVGIYRYMDEVLWIQNDLSWVLRSTDSICSQGDSIKVINDAMEFFSNEKDSEPIFKMSLMNESINGQNKLVLMDDDGGLALTQYSYWEIRLGKLVTSDGKTIVDNLENLLQMNAPKDCTKR